MDDGIQMQAVESVRQQQHLFNGGRQTYECHLNVERRHVRRDAVRVVLSASTSLQCWLK